MDGTEDDGDDAGFTCVVAFYCTLHLDAITVVGGEEVCTDQQQNNRGRFQVGINGLLPIDARSNEPITPDGNESLPFEQAQMSFKFAGPHLVRMGIRAKYLNRCRLGCHVLLVPSSSSIVRQRLKYSINTKDEKQAEVSILACFCVALISSIIHISRHFIVAKDHTTLEAVLDGYAPFYGNKMGHFLTYEQCQNR